MLCAQRQLLTEHKLDLNITYLRRPFFLRRDITAWRKDRGLHNLPLEATRGDVAEAMGWKPPGSDGRLGTLFEAAGGIKAYWGAHEADTMDSHRLAWYAAEVSADKGERMWRALSERYFEGKHTAIRPIRLDNHALLLECAEEAGLNLEEAKRVLTSDAYQREVHESVMAIQRSGVNSIPVLIFESVEVKAPPVVHHGSGSTAAFCTILLKLHAAGMR